MDSATSYVDVGYEVGGGQRERSLTLRVDSAPMNDGIDLVLGSIKGTACGSARLMCDTGEKCLLVQQPCCLFRLSRLQEKCRWDD